MKKSFLYIVVVIFILALQACLPGLAANFKLGKSADFQENRLAKLCADIEPIAANYELTITPKKYKETICSYSDSKGMASLLVGARYLYGEILVTINTTKDQGRNEDFKSLKDQIEAMLASNYPNYKVK